METGADLPIAAKLIAGGSAACLFGAAMLTLRNKVGVTRRDGSVDPSVQNMVVDVASLSDKHARYVSVLRKYDSMISDAMQRLSFARHYDSASYDGALRSLAHLIKLSNQFRTSQVRSGEKGTKIAQVHELRMQIRRDLIRLQKNLRGSASIRKTCRCAAADVMHCLIAHTRTCIMRGQVLHD